MSENIIYCYSGSGNCLDMSKNIAKALGDTDIVMMRSFPAVTDATGYKRVGFVFPCYAGGLPGDVESYVKSIHILPGTYKFAVIQYAGYIGCGLHKIDEIVGLDYWNGVSQQSSAIWLMPHTLTMPPVPASVSQKRSEKTAKKVAEEVRIYKHSPKKPPKMSVFRLMSKNFPDINKKLNAAMNESDDCVSCGTCVEVCPRGYITLSQGKAQIGTNCIGCMACVQYCPKEAINVGRMTVKRERYHNVNITVDDLAQKVIHID